jgi:hypothetical protein
MMERLQTYPIIRIVLEDVFKCKQAGVLYTHPRVTENCTRRRRRRRRLCLA